MRAKTASDKVLDAVIYVCLILLALSTLLPFVNVISKSVSEEWAVVSGKVGLLPVGFQLDTLKYVITTHEFIRAFEISIIVTLIGTLLSLVSTAVTAYPLSKKHLPGVKWMLVLFVFTMLFNGGIIPNYLLMRQLGLINDLWSLVLPALISVFNMLVIKNYYESLPESLEESAKMDGANHITVLVRIIVPLSGPVLATIALFYAVYYWNDFFHPMLYLNSPSLRTLQLYLRDIVMEVNAPGQKTMDELMNVSPEGVRSATIVASTVPILLVYPFLQKYFIKGVLIGSVKG